MKTPRTLEKEFIDSAQMWKFLNYLSVNAQSLSDSDFKLEVQYGRHLKIVAEEDQLSTLEQLMTDFEAGPKPVLRLFCDGGSRGNPGPGACGFVILDEADESVLQGGKFFKYCTNNYAEYMSLKEGVEAALKERIEHLKIYMDSQLVVKQIKGEYKIKHKDLLPIYQVIKSDLASLKSYQITYIPRNHNRLADSVVNQILDQNT